MAAGGQRQIVLLVDDEPSIRLLCRVNLELEGYRVAEAETLAEARAALDAGPVAAVLLDLHVGSHDGRSLLEELLDAEPPVPVAVVSGSTDVETLGAPVLRKPFTIEALLATVRALVESRLPAR